MTPQPSLSYPPEVRSAVLGGAGLALSEAVVVGRLEGLVALRDVLAAQIEGCGSARDVAALSQRLMDVLGQIESVRRLSPSAEGTALDEFTRRRAEREAAGAPRPARRQQRGG
jgi:hypothetical protein